MKGAGAVKDRESEHNKQEFNYLLQVQEINILVPNMDVITLAVCLDGL